MPDNIVPFNTTSGLSAGNTTFTVEFSPNTNKITLTISGGGLDVDTNPQNFNNYTFGDSEIGTDAFNTYPVTFTTEKVYYNGSQWCADLRLTLTNDLNSVENIINETISSFITTPVETGLQDSWTPSNILINHTEGTYATKTVTGQSWVTANSFITCKVLGLTSADHTPEDAILEGVQFEINNIVAGTGFDIVGHAPEGTYGKYTVKCLVQ
jgi:hypothetical protein